jgi:hypothetical protein
MRALASYVAVAYVAVLGVWWLVGKLADTVPPFGFWRKHE